MTTTAFYNGVEITAEVFAVDIRRGRSREIDEFQSASGTVRMRNYDRNFDPPFFSTPSYLLLESGDFLLLESGDKILLEQGSQASGSYGVIEIGGTLVVKDGAVTVFTGHVEDVNYRYDVNGYTEATFVVGDVLTSLASTRFQSEWTGTDDQTSGARVSAVLARSDVDLTAMAGTISAGAIRLQPDEVAVSTNVLQYLQLVSRTENGKLWVDAAGDLQFRGRYDFPTVTPVAEFDDVGTNYGFSDVEVTFGSELRAWQATVQRVGGRAKSATSSLTPPANLGQRGVTRTGLLYRKDSDSEGLAAHLAETLSQPEAVVSSIRVYLHDLGTSPRATIAGVDIHDVVTLTWTPTSSGGTVTQTLVVEGCEYSADSTHRAWVELQLSAYPETNYFILGTDTIDGGTPLGY